ncbi:MAG TPA: phosphatidylserine/phosphatidylglycerophosphate/cardiolipin synthase family protein [Reyranella sp.]|nr:phosphatidylserine/phosphatidylglycerophosphate/cardiolipin synthase family protein [Reyranella sp.]
MIAPASSGSYPRRDGNFVRPLIGGAAAFGRIAEAVDAARHRVWVTVAFYADDFHFPDGRGLFERLDAAAVRGVDVRVVFWRPNPESAHYGRTFAGPVAEGSRVRVRWDCAIGPYCQHQKSWVVDEIGFVGGINLTAKALERHDAYLEVAGPCATDVHHNFVERWNGASEHRDGANDLLLPAAIGAPCGTSVVQIQRMFGADKSILEQYERAIDAAERTIHIENQAIPIAPIAARLERALKRDVEVLLVVPAVPEEAVYAARLDPARRALFDGLEALGRYPNFRLAGLPVYVHAKLMIVDDAWATIGSCNLHAYSLGGSAEMNASIWDAAMARALRADLLRRHENDIFTLAPELYAVSR